MLLLFAIHPPQDPEVQVSPSVHAATVSAHLQTLLPASQISPVA